MNANELADALVEMKGYYGYNEQAATMLRQQQAEIEVLKKHKQHYDHWLKNGVYFTTQEYKELVRQKCTHPAGLTDEEIIHIWNTCETDDEVEELVMKDFILFARAILRKAQEK